MPLFVGEKKGRSFHFLDEPMGPRTAPNPPAGIMMAGIRYKAKTSIHES